MYPYIKEETYDNFSYANFNIDMGNYVSLTSFTNHKMHETCMLEIPDNWLWEESYNVTLDELFMTTMNALKSGYTVAWCYKILATAMIIYIYQSDVPDGWRQPLT